MTLWFDSQVTLHFLHVDHCYLRGPPANITPSSHPTPPLQAPLGAGAGPLPYGAWDHSKCGLPVSPYAPLLRLTLLTPVCTCVHFCVCAPVCTCLCLCVYACVHVCMPEFAHVHVRICACVRTRACTHPHKPTRAVCVANGPVVK